MHSPSDLHVAPGATLPSGVSPSTGCPRAGTPCAHDELECGCAVTIQLDLDSPHLLISVTGALGRSGGALLMAVLEYVREQHGRPVAVDLRGVSHVDRHGLAPIAESGVAVTATSSAVDQVLAGVTTKPSGGLATLERTGSSERLPGSAKPSSYKIPWQPDRVLASPRLDPHTRSSNPTKSRRR